MADLLTGRIEANRPLTREVFRMELTVPGLGPQQPGQFVNLRIPELYLRRPISIFNQEGEQLTLIYKTVGRGTERLSRMAPGESLELLTGLGRGFDPRPAGDSPLLLGGGVGVPPLYYLARKLLLQGAQVTVGLGFNTAAEILCLEDFQALGCRVLLATADGSKGQKGFVTDLLPPDYSYVYTCGPLPMLRAVYDRIRTDGQFSFEERMGCGFGACMGCTHPSTHGPVRICREGPVLTREEIDWGLSDRPQTPSD